MTARVLWHYPLTMNTYGHIIESMKREAADPMDGILKPVAVKPRAGKFN